MAVIKVMRLLGSSWRPSPLGGDSGGRSIDEPPSPPEVEGRRARHGGPASPTPPVHRARGARPMPARGHEPATLCGQFH
jgi:hypothetical protein